jgi:hypothetical protein
MEIVDASTEAPPAKTELLFRHAVPSAELTPYVLDAIFVYQGQSGMLSKITSIHGALVNACRRESLLGIWAIV